MAPLIGTEESIEAYRRRLDGVAYATYILIMLVVPLKLYCRKRSGGWSNIRMDDYLSVAALLCANGFFYVCIIGMRKSLGLHAATLASSAQVIDFLRNVFIANILYTFCISTIKFSVLAFYWRLFAVNARISIYIVTFMAVSWCTAIFFCVLFSCIPVQAAWDITIVGAKCIPIRSIYLGGSVPNVVLDLILVLLPVPYVMRLNAPLAQRIVLAGMFALGIFIAIVSLVRLIIFLQIPIATAGDATYNFREVIVWSIVEVNIGLTCACLPSLKPALAMLGITKLFSFNNSRPSNMPTPGASSQFPSNRNLSGSKLTGRSRKKGATGGMFSTLAGMSRLDSEEEGFKMMDDNGRGKHNVEIEMNRISQDSSRRTPQGLNGINVQTNWSVFVDERRETRA
ncbi:hypothetical protein GQ43DRAFT_435834 [Delitschia confertaspora ATCC 74209]|uniref:Rhodopsin domain-containing protein n=1 Tax=Delitschia confertaspora ATCC 74209 TaxID=1513339 RepID=A0A9P4MU11_9PLEO|nr:hypothetical protein GQ43DRAFT_435834 [Delitschia confertaspora ATCC 74209]